MAEIVAHKAGENPCGINWKTKEKIETLTIKPIMLTLKNLIYSLGTFDVSLDLKVQNLFQKKLFIFATINEIALNNANIVTVNPKKVKNTFTSVSL